MRTMFFAIAATALLAAPATAQSTGPDNPTWTLENPASCQGAMRGGRSSPGGDREYGGLDDGLVPFLEFLKENGLNFGDFLRKRRRHATTPRLVETSDQRRIAVSPTHSLLPAQGRRLIIL